MNLKMPTDLDPRIEGPRPHEAAVPVAQPMPTLAQQGVPTRRTVAVPQLPKTPGRGQ